MAAADDDAWMWTQYWRSPRLACCLNMDQDYDEEIANLWRAHFACLPHGARILDLCAGNGAVAIMAAEFSAAHDMGFIATAVDRALIEPYAYLIEGHPRAADVVFIGGIDLDAWSPQPASFEGIVSQFGIEYTDWRANIERVCGGLAAGGRLLFLMHAQGEAVWRAAQTEHEQIAWEDSLSVVALAEKYCREDELSLAGAEIEAARARRDAVAEELKQAMARWSGDGDKSAAKQATIRSVALTLAAIPYHGHAAVTAKLAEVRESVLAHKARMEALMASALSSAGIEELLQRLSALGLASARAEMFTHPRHGAIGWLVSAERPA